jgi:hypothetical protein
LCYHGLSFSILLLFNVSESFYNVFLRDNIDLSLPVYYSDNFLAHVYLNHSYLKCLLAWLTLYGLCLYLLFIYFCLSLCFLSSFTTFSNLIEHLYGSVSSQLWLYRLHFIKKLLSLLEFTLLILSQSLYTFK